jgi:hypothetical protein
LTHKTNLTLPLLIKVSVFLKYHTTGTVLKYHTTGTVLKYHTTGTVLKYHTTGTVLKFNGILVEKVNPVSGCLPIMVQIPVFIAFYWMLLDTVELRQTAFWWMSDLSARYYIDT